VRHAPVKALGQHFLVDRNILGVIGRLAELAADDVVLDVVGERGQEARYVAGELGVEVAPQERVDLVAGHRAGAAPRPWA
jgi:hypothetical protein